MKKIKEHIKAIIFDMDGTIIHSEHIWEKANLHVLTKRGFCTFSPEQEAVLQTFSGIGMHAAMTILKKEFHLPDEIEDLCKEVQREAIEQFSHTIEFVNGFEYFHELITSHNIPIALATNSDIESMHSLATNLGFGKMFGIHLYSIGHVEGKAKPNPAVFLHAAEQLGVKPEECLVFEDSLFGMQAALAAGMKVIAIKNERNNHFLDHAHHAINHYHEAEHALAELIGKHFEKKSGLREADLGKSGEEK